MIPDEFTTARGLDWAYRVFVWLAPLPARERQREAERGEFLWRRRR